ncbi:MAG: signal peptidase I, partial [Oscillospiraceae bacterium]|nr:signal peptidase I [Oscillospiraceae bacterium]
MNDEALNPSGEQKPDQQKGSFRMDLYFWMQALAVALVALILIFTLAGRVIRVVGDSMLPTLHENDLMLLQSIGYEPQQGDIVVLRKASFMPEPVVKRVIATAGQHVTVDYVNHCVLVDGVALEEPYINEIMNDPHSS